MDAKEWHEKRKKLFEESGLSKLFQGGELRGRNVTFLGEGKQSDGSVDEIAWELIVSSVVYAQNSQDGSEGFCLRTTTIILGEAISLWWDSNEKKWKLRFSTGSGSSIYWGTITSP